MNKFVIQRGAYRPAKLEYSYGRRAQSVTETLQWIDSAIISAETPQDALAIASETIQAWKQQSHVFAASRWRVEGRGMYATFAKEIE
jgi:hypothetical protein